MRSNPRARSHAPCRGHLDELRRLVVWAGLLLISPPFQPAVVRAVLFYSPTCPHCYQVVTQDLPPVVERFGSQVEIIGVDTTSRAGSELYQAAVERFSIPEERRGVPTLIVGETVLVGSLEIPEQFPMWIERYLAQGGVDWPDIPGLAQALAAAASGATADSNRGPPPVAATTEVAPSAPSEVAAIVGLSRTHKSARVVGAGFASDPVGSTVAVAVLLFMVFTVGWVFRDLLRPSLLARHAWHNLAIPALCLVGTAVAGYLAYVEATHTQAVCGPVGDCNTVQQSEFARLFGVIPIGALGSVGFAAMGAIWLAHRWSAGAVARRLDVALFALALSGTLFSIYLTFLEPFVIGANCAWCLTSAVIMTLLLRLTVPDGLRKAASRELRDVGAR